MKLYVNIIINMNFNYFHHQNTIRIISFNLNEKLRNPKCNNEIFRLLKELNADIICLQEAGDIVHIEKLAEQLNMYWHFGIWHIGGMTILSKFKIISIINVDIPDSYYNALIAIKVEPGIWISCIHLSSENYLIDDGERFRELAFILDKLDELKADKLIVAGDFNLVVGQLMESRKYIDTHKNKLWCNSTGYQPNIVKELIVFILGVIFKY